MEDKKLKGDIGEDFVNQIAYKSLLKYWCYPGPKDEHGDKKEICDLLVLFKDICIIISVKNYDFDGDYDRYNRKTIEKALKQISGAERKLFNFPREIYIKHPEKYLEKFEKSKYSKVYRIIVNLGEGVDIYNPAHITEGGNFVTIFNKDTLETILGELDTISDFTEYLTTRENFLQPKSQIQWLCEEKDIFAAYLGHGRKFPEEFTSNNFDLLIVNFEGEWNRFREENKGQLEEKKALDKDSYFLDELVERELTKLPKGDLIAQELLTLDRFQRRIFVNLFYEFYGLHNTEIKMATAHRYFELGEYGVVFFYYSPDFVSTPFPDNALHAAIIGHSLQSNYSKKKMLGFGTTHEMQQFKFQYIQYDKPLESQEIEPVQKFIKEMGWFKNLTYNNYKDKEFLN
jgi:hypothetical protein